MLRSKSKVTKKSISILVVITILIASTFPSTIVFAANTGGEAQMTESSMGIQAVSVFTPAEDTSDTVYNNPAMGWQLYLETLDDGIPADIDAYMNSFSAASINAATSIYVRAAWSELEPTQGNYAWNDPNSWISKLETWAVNHGKKLAFSVYVVCQDCTQVAVPAYVQNDPLVTGHTHFYLANGTYAFSPNEYNARFQQLYEAFLTAFAAKYDNPDLVDYIDGNGMGLWGESHWSYSNYLTDDQKDQIYHWIIAAFKSRFKKVLLVDNYVRDYWNGVDFGFRYYLRDWGLKFNGYSMRRNSLGSPYVAQYQKDRLNSNFPEKAVFGENYYHHFITNPYWNQNYPTLDAALTQVVADAKNFHCNTLDLRKPQDANTWTGSNMSLVNDFIRNGGYRLVPTSISYPNTVTSGSEYTVSHSWKNTGVGKLPNNADNWNYKYKVAFALLNTSTGAPVYTFIDSAEPSDWAKGQSYNYSSKVTFTGVPSGTYDFAMAIVDRDKAYTPGIKLGIINARTSTGWYKLGTTIVSGSSTRGNIQTSAKAFTTSGQASGMSSSINNINDGTTANQFFSNVGVTLPQYVGLNWGGKTVTADRISLSSTYAAQTGITNIDVEYFDGKVWKTAAKNKSITWATNSSTAEEKEILLGTNVVTSHMRIKVNSANLALGRFTLSEFKVLGALSASTAAATNISPYSIASSTAQGNIAWGTVKNITDGNYASAWGTDPYASTNFPQDIILDFDNRIVRVDQIKLATHYGKTGGITSVDIRCWNGNAWVDAALNQTFTYTLNNDTEEIWTINFGNANFATTKIKITAKAGSSPTKFAVNDIEVWGWGPNTAPEYYDFARLGKVSATVPSDPSTPLYSINDGDETLAWASSTAAFGSDKYIEVDFQGATAALDKITFAAWYGANQGITKPEVQYYDNGVWKNAAVNRTIYPDWTSTDTTIEYRSESFDTVYTTKVRIIIRDAHLVWNHYAINELYLYGYLLK